MGLGTVCLLESSRRLRFAFYHMQPNNYDPSIILGQSSTTCLLILDPDKSANDCFSSLRCSEFL